MAESDNAPILRRAVLRYLALRHPLQFTRAQIAGALRARSLVDFAFTDHELTSALAILDDRGLAHERRVDQLGSEMAYAATADGVIQIEAGT